METHTLSRVPAAHEPEWRFGRGWSERELEEQLAAVAQRPRTGPVSEAESYSTAWRHYYSEATIAMERPGLPEPGGAFERAKVLISRYEFSDPRIVVGHYDPEVPLLGRRMLLELKVMGLRYLCGVSVEAVRDETLTNKSIFGFRYDTLEGHIEAGAEWFLLTKEHDTGRVFQRIQAAWRPGEFPNWWSRLGFEWVGRRYQRAWHRLSYVRMRTFLESKDLPPLPVGRRIVHEGYPLDAQPPVASVAPPAAGPVADVPVEVQS